MDVDLATAIKIIRGNHPYKRHFDTYLSALSAVSEIPPSKLPLKLTEAQSSVQQVPAISSIASEETTS
jgi:hypothetical protein